MACNAGCSLITSMQILVALCLVTSTAARPLGWRHLLTTLNPQTLQAPSQNPRGWAGRHLLRSREQQSDGTYVPYSNARIYRVPSSGVLSRTATTDEDAEATANAGHTSIKRLIAPSDRRSYATVEAYDGLNPDRKEVAVQPRAKGGIDRPGAPYVKSGTTSVGMLAMGGAAVSQTYMGAHAIASTDAVAMTKGSHKTAMSANLINTTPSSFKRASKSGSFGYTGKEAGSLALSGASNGLAVLAEADSAVALVQTEKTSSLESRFAKATSPFDRLPK